MWCSARLPFGVSPVDLALTFFYFEQKIFVFLFFNLFLFPQKKSFRQNDKEGMEIEGGRSSRSSATGVKGQSVSDAPLLTTPALEDGKDGKGSLDEIKTVPRLASEEAQRDGNEYEEGNESEEDKVQYIMDLLGISGVHWY